MRPNPIAPWQLRIGNLRVYYDIEDQPELQVRVMAVGKKLRNRVNNALLQSLQTETYSSLADRCAPDQSTPVGIDSLNGRLYYETPYGEIHLTDPYPDGNKSTEHWDAAEP